MAVEAVEPKGDPWSPGRVRDLAHSGPTVLRILLGGQLRRLREAKGISREDAGEAIRASGSKISRLELGRVGFKRRDVADLLTLYGVVDADEREALLGLAVQASTPGWWHHYGDVLPAWFEVYIGLEEAASVLRIHETRFVPELLQTEAYARAAAALGHPGAGPTEIDRRVGVLMRRQQILTRPDPPQLWVVLDEAVLHRRVGGAEVMRDQLASLIEAVRAGRVILQIVPPRHSALAAFSGPFSLLRFAEPSLPDIVFLEQLTSALYLDKPADLVVYKKNLDRLYVNAAPPTESARILTGILGGLG
ncbi:MULTISPECIES: helix-turn-helix domain-containing protein [Actinomadura]|uniref:Helix-turn-helix domain-containing protein n=1 Tax=Actinomadura yumaensis TaxID=111807 RepID=A0ABW2CYQ8_9ACTN